VTAIDAVENHFAPADQRLPALLDHCAVNGIAFLAYSPLSGTHVGEAHRPPSLDKLAADWGRSAAQLALAWELSLSPAMIPLVGARRPSTILDSAQALRWQPSEAELQLLTQVFAVASALEEESRDR
jgi:diketogulonate reductase-like aldo/keto reductase